MAKIELLVHIEGTQKTNMSKVEMLEYTEDINMARIELLYFLLNNKT